MQYNMLSLDGTQTSGMRAYFGRIYNYMAGGLAVSGITAYLSAQDPLFSLFYKISNGMLTLSFLGWIAVLSPLVMMFMINSAVAKMNADKARMLFFVFSALMGVSLSKLLLMYTGASLFQSFLICSASFLGLSLYGYTTQKSLASWGSFLFMGLYGVILAVLVNVFMQSAAVNLAVSVISVFIFVGLTIYDTNRLKMMYHEDMPEDMKKSLAVNGALALYLDFINLFRLIVYFLGDRR